MHGRDTYEADVRSDAARRSRMPLDQELVALAAQASQAQRDADAAVGRLLSLCRPLAERIARGYSPSAPDVADMGQEALFYVARHLRELREPSAFSSWLAAVVHSTCKQWVRRQKRWRAAQSLDALQLALGADAPPGAAAPWHPGAPGAGPGEPPIEQIDLRDLLVGLLRTLPDREREAVVRRYLDDQPQLEVSRRMGLSGRAVESLVYRAVRRLRTVATQSRAAFEDLGVWCPVCGVHRLAGCLQPGGGPEHPLRLRATCPGCAPGNTEWMNLPVALASYAWPGAALVEGYGRLGAVARALVRAPAPRCAGCGASIAPSHGADLLGPLAWECDRCAFSTRTDLTSVAAAAPELRAVWHAAPRLRFVDTRPMADGKAVAVTVLDAARGRTARVLLDRRTLAVRAVESEGV